MMAAPEIAFPTLAGWEPTRDSLHAYSKVLGAFARVLAKPHPQWWHVSLKLDHGLLWTDELDPSGARLRLSLDLQQQMIRLHSPAGVAASVDLQSELTANELAAALIQAIHSFDLDPTLPLEQYENDEPRKYDARMAQSYLQALELVFQIQSAFRDGLPGRKGSVQLWPHNFDQAFEWFSERMVEPAGASRPSPAQINFGFAPGDATHAQPYFYSNPWPFPADLKRESLPSGAIWFDQGWTGSLLSYEILADLPEGQQMLKAYYQRIFDLAYPIISQ